MTARALTVAQVAERLAISPSSVRALIARGALPCHRPTPQTIRLDPEDVEAYWRGCRSEAAPAVRATRAPAPTLAEVDARLREVLRTARSSGRSGPA